jgi:hypothetical protein
METLDNPRPRRRLGGCVLGGCLALLALVAIPPVVIFAWAANPGPAADWDDTVSAHPVPGATVPAALPAKSPDAEAAPGDATSPAAPTAAALPIATAGRPGRIVLDVAMAELAIVPVAAGEPVRLHASYDRARFELIERLDEVASGWSYELTFQARGVQRFWDSGTRRPAKLRLEVPRGTPIELEGELGLGDYQIELGGLSLANVDLELGVGQHSVAFSEPTAAPLRLLRLHSGMGELTVIGAGNASPEQISVEQGMGELELDLRGAWKADGLVDIQIGMGECRVLLPERHQAGGLVVDSDIGMGSRNVDDVAESELPPGLPRVRINAEGGMGNIDIR